MVPWGNIKILVNRKIVAEGSNAAQSNDVPDVPKAILAITGPEEHGSTSV